MNRSLHATTVALFVVISMTHWQPAMAQSKLLKTTVTYREVDGHKILADVYRPQGDHVLPVIVWIHGGALIMGHREGIHSEVRALAEDKGYALVSIDYRLAPETKLPELISDIEAAFRWLAGDGARQFHLDRDRVVVVGGSAGGYLTLVTGFRAKPQPKALVALYGYGDLIGDWYSTPSPHPRHNARKITSEEAAKQTDGTIVSDARHRQGNGGVMYLHYRQNGTWPREVSGFDPAKIAEKITPFEPLRNVTPDYPPTLLIHGTKDTDVPYQQSAMMAEQLREHGVSFILKPIMNGEHGFGGGDLEEIEDAYKTMREFIVKHLSEPSER
jgi:acetyl esterase/lipase